MRFPLLAAPLCLACAAPVATDETSDSDPQAPLALGPPASTWVTPEEGGALLSADGALSISVPPGAVSEPVDLGVAQVDADGHPAWLLSPPSLTLGAPIHLSLELDPSPFDASFVVAGVLFEEDGRAALLQVDGLELRSVSSARARLRAPRLGLVQVAVSDSQGLVDATWLPLPAGPTLGATGLWVRGADVHGGARWLGASTLWEKHALYEGRPLRPGLEVRFEAGVLELAPSSAGGAPPDRAAVERVEVLEHRFTWTHPVAPVRPEEVRPPPARALADGERTMFEPALSCEAPADRVDDGRLALVATFTELRTTPGSYDVGRGFHLGPGGWAETEGGPVDPAAGCVGIGGFDRLVIECRDDDGLVGAILETPEERVALGATARRLWDGACTPDPTGSRCAAPQPEEALWTSLDAVLELSAAARARLLDGVFGCPGDESPTWCGEAPPPEGAWRLVIVEHGGPVPLAEDREQHERLIAFDTDGLPDNDWVPAVIYPEDPRRGTDAWLGLVAAPQGGWRLVSAGPEGERATAARIAVHAHQLALLVPVDEVGGESPFRVIASRHDGTAGAAGAPYSSDRAPEPAAGLAAPSGLRLPVDD